MKASKQIVDIEIEDLMYFQDHTSILYENLKNMYLEHEIQNYIKLYTKTKNMLKNSNLLMMEIDFNSSGKMIKRSIKADKKELVILDLIIDNSPHKH